MKRPAAVALALVVALLGPGCVPVRHTPPVAPAPTAQSEWPAVHAQVMSDVRASRLAAADRALTEFAQRYPGSAEASEVPYWRAVLRLDPSIPGVLRESLAMLESYLASTPNGAHRAEASTLQRLGVALEQRNAALAAIPPAPTVKPEDRAKEEEIQRLRDELAKANAELDRIRRRLARPRQ